MLAMRKAALVNSVIVKMIQTTRAFFVPKASEAIGKRPTQGGIQLSNLIQVSARMARSLSSIPRAVTMGRPDGSLIPQATQILALAGRVCSHDGQIGPPPVPPVVERA